MPSSFAASIVTARIARSWPSPLAAATAASCRSTRTFGTYPSNAVPMHTGTPRSASTAAFPTNPCSVSMLDAARCIVGWTTTGTPAALSWSAIR